MKVRNVKKLFAFWRHSFQAYLGFRGVLGAEMLDMDDVERVSVKGYDGMRFNPVLRSEYETEMRRLNSAFEQRFRALFGDDR